MKVLIAGSIGLIGAEAVSDYHRTEHKVHGLDNNMRQEFFGTPGDNCRVRAVR
jgi:nucleoside-diphosphate-sugar epimerase